MGDHKQMCDYFIECMMLPLLPDRISNSIGLIRNKAFVQFKFLVEIFKLELFIRSGSVEVSSNLCRIYVAFVEAFLDEPTEQGVPNIENFTKHLFILGVDSRVIAAFKQAFVVFILSDFSGLRVRAFEKRIHSFICAFFETIEPLDIFEVARSKVDPTEFDRPFVVLKPEVLGELKEVQQIKTREQA